MSTGAKAPLRMLNAALAWESGFLGGRGANAPVIEA